MANLSSATLSNNTTSSGLNSGYKTIGSLSSFTVNGIIYKVEVNTNSNASSTNFNTALTGPDGRTVAYYDSTKNKWIAGQNIPTSLSEALSKNQSFVDALTASSYYTAFFGNGGNQAKATQITGINPNNTSSTFKPQGQGLNGAIPQNQSSPGILNPLEAIAGISTQFNDNIGDTFLKNLGNGGFLKYPLDILDSGQDILKIEQFRYQPPRASIFTDPEKILQNGIQRSSVLKESLVTVMLPIPNNLQDSNNVSWGPDNMNALTAAAAGGVLNNMSGVAGAAALGLGAGAILAALTGRNVGSAAGTGASLAIKASIWKGLVDQALKSQNAQALVGTGLASQALNMAGFEVSPESILANAAGIVPNSNLELLFNSPTLREFKFDYRFSPRSSQEAAMVRKIIRSFKQGMAPRKLSASSGAGAAAYFLSTPNVFKITYKSEGTDGIPGLNKFKICALTGFSVNYTPDGQWSAYDGGQPVSYIVSMAFNELEPIYENDYQENIYDDFKGKKDLEPITPGDIGY